MQKLDAATALDGFFQVVRQEALANPVFARRLLEALGCTVEFRGEEALAAVDPVLVAVRGADEFRRTFLSMKAKDIAKIGHEAGLVEKDEIRGKKIGPLVDLLWERASERMRDLFPHARHAAE